jgi:hypothetical protein
MNRDEYYKRRGCERTLIKLVFILFVILFSCQGEQPYCWICHIKERYVDEHNKIGTIYKYDIIIPSMTQRDIYLLEDANTQIIDETRMIGTMMECNIAN